ncbi:extracellular serine/threonine protein CG31145-like isoform X2 [Physella acuta]|uniref:extracellular serine/threonine protein CG31145-like isoform X2 n=1 Tax=Physella acuta TaxID=109671 RepID=UPI0027DBCE4E|nr:extracellular serine/threonine protein CG31145-like isoform X2 [Physella acuta]
MVKKFREIQKPKTSMYYLDDDEPYMKFIKRLKLFRKKGLSVSRYFNLTGNSSWQRFQRNVNQYYLYDPDQDNIVADLLNDLSKRPIVATRCKRSSTHLALLMTFDNGGQAVFKAIRLPKYSESPLNSFYFSDIERPTAEIAAFHLDMLLAFYRAPPTVGRVINISSDIIMVGDEDIKRTAHWSPTDNLCFVGKCKDYCVQGYAVCGSPYLLEGSLSAYLPNRSLDDAMHHFHSPYAGSYSYRNKAKWENNDTYCDLELKTKPFYNGRALFDQVDMAVFDFLQGNMDRHSFETFKMFGNDTFFLHYDNGRGFGKKKLDYVSLLAPVRQCCKVRLSTLAKLVKLYTGPDSLSQLLRTSLSSDPLAPVLDELYLDSVDRRVGLVLSAVYDCVNRTGSWDQVIVNDGVV